MKKDWVGAAERLSDLVYDGHFTLMKFTTNWRAGFFTPENREEINKMAAGATKDEACKKLIEQHNTGELQ